MRDPPIILENVVILNALCNCNLSRHGQDFGKLVLRDVMELSTMELGDDQLCVGQLSNVAKVYCEEMYEIGLGTACPLLSGPMSKNASVLELSKIFSDGISPARLFSKQSK